MSDENSELPFGVFKPPRGVVGKDGKITRPPFEGFDRLLSAASQGEEFFFSGGGGDVCKTLSNGCAALLTLGPQVGQVDLKGRTELWFFFPEDPSRSRSDGEWLCVLCPTSALLIGGLVYPLLKYPPTFSTTDARRVCARLKELNIGSADYWHDLRLLLFMSLWGSKDTCEAVSRTQFFRFSSREVWMAQDMLARLIDSAAPEVDDYLKSAVVQICQPILSRSLKAQIEGRTPEVEIDMNFSPQELVALCKRVLSFVKKPEDRAFWIDMLHDIADATAPDDAAPDPSSAPN